jgi:hypothetical protein
VELGRGKKALNIRLRNGTSAWLKILWKKSNFHALRIQVFKNNKILCTVLPMGVSLKLGLDTPEIRTRSEANSSPSKKMPVHPLGKRSIQVKHKIYFCKK